MRLALMSLIAATGMILTGCASSTTTGARGAGTVSTAPDHQVDYAKMAQVERLAMSRGVRVFWVNPPEKP